MHFDNDPSFHQRWGKNEGQSGVWVRMRPRNSHSDFPQCPVWQRKIEMWLFGQICFPPLGRAPLMRQFRRRGHRRWKRSRGGAGGDGWSSERNGNWRLPHRPSDFWPLNMSILSRQKIRKMFFSRAVLSTLLHASNYFLAVPKMIDGKLANFL